MIASYLALTFLSAVSIPVSAKWQAPGSDGLSEFESQYPTDVEIQGVTFPLHKPVVDMARPLYNETERNLPQGSNSPYVPPQNPSKRYNQCRTLQVQTVFRHGTRNPGYSKYQTFY